MPDADKLAEERLTEVVDKDGASETIRDKWTGSSCHRSSGKKWTGRAIFYRKAAANVMLAGALLASICPQSICASQVGQLISPDAQNFSLAGPVCGKRAAVLQGTPGGSWQPAGSLASLGSSEACSGPWRLIIRGTTAGADASSSESQRGLHWHSTSSTGEAT